MIIYPIPITGLSIDPNSVILQNRKTILAAGRMHKFKQFNLLIKAFVKIADKYPDWDLVILGDGEERNFLEQLLVDLEISDRVFFPGSVGNVSEWYEKVDLFVLSSLVEGYPNVLLEAMAYGVPCISFDCETGPSELIKDRINGILVNPNTKEIGLSKAISEVIANEKFRKSLSTKASKMRELNSVNKIIDKWNQCLSL
tara:strand:- start:37 stop:633 length:597 start_codon:yes stop_codon:yes gene_type:complete